MGEKTIIKYLCPFENPLHFHINSFQKNFFFFFGWNSLRVIYLISPSCRVHVPERERLGVLANWADLTREICAGEKGVSLTLCGVLEGNQTFTCSLLSLTALKITCGHHRVIEDYSLWCVFIHVVSSCMCARPCMD